MDGPVDLYRLAQAADARYGLRYRPTLAVADRLYGYWPEASFAASGVTTVI